MTNLKPYDISKRRVLVATRTKTCAGKFSVPLLKMGEGLPRPTCRSRPQTTSMLLCPKDMVVSDRGKGVIKASGVCREDERKRTVRLGIETPSDAVKTAGPNILRDQLGGYLHTDQVAAGV